MLLTMLKKLDLKTTLLYQFNSLLARQMLNVETNHQHTGKAALYLLFQTLIIIRIIAVAQHTGC